MLTSDHVIDISHLFDVLLQDFGDGLRVLSVLFCDGSEVADLISIVAPKIFERFSEVFGNISGGCSRERTSRRPRRHCNTSRRMRRRYFNGGWMLCRVLTVKSKYAREVLRNERALRRLALRRAPGKLRRQ